MKAENRSTDHNRTIHLTGIPSSHPHDPTEMLITINYVHKRTPAGDGPAVIDMAVTLDRIIIPEIIAAINSGERDYTCLTPDEQAEGRKRWECRAG